MIGIKKIKTRWVLLAIGAMALAGTDAQAQSSPISGTVNSQLVLTSSCVVSAGTVASGAGSWGTLNFGTQPATFTGQLTAQATGGSSSATQITCSSDVTALTVTVNGGNNAGLGTTTGTGARAMTNGTDYVPYDVYSDAAHAHVYPTTGSLSVAVPAVGQAFSLPIYGVASKTSAIGLSTGTYADMLSVTVAW